MLRAADNGVLWVIRKSQVIIGRGLRVALNLKIGKLFR